MVSISLEPQDADIIPAPGTDTRVGKSIRTAASPPSSRDRDAAYKPCQLGASAGDSGAAGITGLTGP